MHSTARGRGIKKITRETIFRSAALVGADSALRTKPNFNVPWRGGDRMAAKKGKKTAAKKDGGSKRKPNAAFMKAMQPSQVIETVVGGKPIAPTDDGQ